MSTQEIIQKYEEVSIVAQKAVNESKTFKEEVNAKLLPLETEIKSLEAKLAQAEEDSKKSIQKIEEAINSGFKSVSEKTDSKSYVPLSLKEAQYIAEALNSHKQAKFFISDKKTIRFGDATSTNTIDRPATVMGSFEVNKDIPSTILQDVDLMPAVNDNEGALVWNTFDESLIEAFEANELDAALTSKEVVYRNVKLALKKVQAKMNISTDVIINVLQGGNQVPVLERNIAGLNRKYDKKIIKDIFQDIIASANNNLVGKTATTTQYAPADATIRKDLRNFLSTLKKEFIGNSVIYVSRQLINAAFSVEASDGHLPLEQFSYSNNIQAFVTPEGLIPVRTFEHAQIGTYKSLHDGSTDITSDYTPVTGSLSGNAGKLLAFVGDLKFAYKVIPSAMGIIGYESGVGTLLDGATKAGKIGYVAQGIVESQAIKALYAKA